MTHREALLEAILDYPDDDLPRLAYADACEEEGLLEVANMIRVSLEYAETFDCLDRDGYCFMDVELGSCELCKRRDILHESLEGLFVPAVTDHFAYGLTEEIRRSHLLALVKPTINFSTVVFWRGWIREVALTQDLFLQHAKTLFNSHPIERVRLIDRVPVPYEAVNPYVRSNLTEALPFTNGGTGDRVAATDQMYVWTTRELMGFRHSYVSPLLWPFLKKASLLAEYAQYASINEANADLESAALAYGKSLRKSRRHQEGSRHASL